MARPDALTLRVVATSRRLRTFHLPHPPPMPPDTSRSDGWVLRAVALAADDGSAPLERVVAAGDACNRAVFDAAELSTCLGRLLSAGLVVRTGDEYALEPGTRARLGRARATRHRHEAERLVRETDPDALPVPDGTPSEAACARAIGAYLRLAQRRARSGA